jgi:hypothetical protein
MGSDHKAAYRGSITEASPCEELEDDGPLNSVDMAVVRTLSKDQKLRLRLDDSMPPPQVLAVTEDGRVAGSITSPMIGRLVACMGQRYSFQAVVLSVQGGIATVRYFCLGPPGA